MRSAVHLCCQLQQCFDPKLLVSVSAGRSSFASSASRARHFFSTEEYMEPPFGGPNRCQENLLAKQLLVYMSWKAWELGGNSLECKRWHRNGRIECVVVRCCQCRLKRTGSSSFAVEEKANKNHWRMAFFHHQVLPKLPWASRVPATSWKEADLRRLLEQVHLESGTGTLATKGVPPPGQIWGALQGVCWPQSWCFDVVNWKNGWLSWLVATNTAGYGSALVQVPMLPCWSCLVLPEAVGKASRQLPGEFLATFLLLNIRNPHRWALQSRYVQIKHRWKLSSGTSLTFDPARYHKEGYFFLLWWQGFCFIVPPYRACLTGRPQRMIHHGYHAGKVDLSKIVTWICNCIVNPSNPGQQLWANTAEVESLLADLELKWRCHVAVLFNWTNGGKHWQTLYLRRIGEKCANAHIWPSNYHRARLSKEDMLATPEIQIFQKPKIAQTSPSQKKGPRHGTATLTFPTALCTPLEPLQHFLLEKTCCTQKTRCRKLRLLLKLISRSSAA